MAELEFLKIFHQYINGMSLNALAKENSCTVNDVINAIHEAKSHP